MNHNDILKFLTCLFCGSDDMPNKVFLNTQDYTVLMDENRVLKDNIATLQQQNEQLKASNDQAQARRLSERTNDEK